MKVRIKKLVSEAIIPEYASEGDAGLDLVATDKVMNSNKGYIEFGTGLAIEIPKGYVGLIFPRSSISKSKYTLANSVGVIDSGYRGEIKFRFFMNTAFIAKIDPRIQNANFTLEDYEVGDKIGQLIIMPYPSIELEEVEELVETERGEGGFGSTGK